MKEILSNIIKVILIIVVIISITDISKADTTTKLSLKPDKTSVTNGEEFTVSIYISNIDLKQGIMCVSGEILYDSKILEPITSDNTTYNGWTTSWNTSNGVILVDRGNAILSEQCIAKLKFKVKENTNVNENIISFSNISVYNSEEEQECSNTSCKITLKTEDSPTDNNKKPNEDEEKPKEDEKQPQETPTQGQPENQGQQAQQKPNTQTQQTTTNKSINNKNTKTPVKNSTSNEEIPYLGVSEWIVGAIVLITIIGIFAYRGYKKYNNI